MVDFGVDLDGLGSQVEEIVLPPVVPQRCVHIDADFLAYQCSAVGDGSEKSFDDMKHNAGVAIQTLQNLAGAERVHLHLTPKGSNKGERFEIAIQKEYQGNRKDKEKPKYLDLMREHLATMYPGTMHMLCEADDGMSSSQYEAIATGAAGRSVIASKDKDLRMVPGYQLDWDTGQLHYTDPTTPFGYIELCDKGSAKKIRGYGQKFFWSQMLTGDTADNIQGLPKLCGKVLNKIEPTAATQKLSLIALGPNSNEAQKQKAQRELDSRSKACGPVLAAKVLSYCTSNKQCFEVVRLLYQSYGDLHGFKHWKTGEPVPWQHVFVSEAKLLWMRKNVENQNDVINWFKEIQTQ